MTKTSDSRRRDVAAGARAMSRWRSFSPRRGLATTVCGYVFCPHVDPQRTALLPRDVCDGRGPSWQWLTAQGVASARLVRCDDGRAK